MPDLPTGTVTFLFTDIEGSTSRWEQQTQTMQRALARHDAILQHTIDLHGGAVFKTVGDAFYAVFASAPAALHAALAAQRALLLEAWDEAIGPLRVRMALHTGTPEARTGDYFGPPLNRLARLLSAGYGGQILLSHATQELVRDHLPPSIKLRDLGAYRLRDLIRPERVFQLVAPDLPGDFPALKTLDHRPNNLPVQRTPLIGREQEVARVTAWLCRSDVGLVTLIGPGGMGKTSLSLQVAANLLEAFVDGVWFVELAPISDPALVAPTIAHTLGVKEVVSQPLPDSLQAYLREKQMLLVLDNFEQVVAAAALVDDLLRSAPRLKVLVTSRVVLGVYGEHAFQVPPLALPDLMHLPPLERLTQYEAVRLFIDRAHAAKADFHVTNDNAPAVAEICHRLDGLPLAIELAAARVRLLPPQALLQRLRSRLTLLTGGARTRPPRQQTLRDAIAWSYDLLNPVEQTLFTRLAVFAGGCTLDAAETICQAPSALPLASLDGLAMLVDKSLLRQGEGEAGEARFTMLETIREYAGERLAERLEADALSERHAGFFLALAEEAAPQLRGAHQIVWLRRLEAEHDNLRAALRWTLERGHAEFGLRLAGALWPFWARRGHLSEGRRWLDKALAVPGTIHPGARARALVGAGLLAGNQGEYLRATALVEESLGLARAMGDNRLIAAALFALGDLASDQGNIGRAAPLYEEALTLFREQGAVDKIATSVLNLGRMMALGQRDYTRAAPLLEESLELYRQLEDQEGIVYALLHLGLVALVAGNPAGATDRFAEALRRSWSAGNRTMVAYSFVAVGAVGTTGGKPARAARLFGAAEALREALGAPLAPVEQLIYAQYVSGARGGLDEATFAAAWAEGRAMPLEQAIAYALEEDADSGSAEAGAG